MLNIEFADGAVTVNGVLLTVPVERTDLLRVVGPPDRETSKRYNTILTWDKLGLCAYEMPETEQSGHFTSWFEVRLTILAP